jgi:hypothetical protein
MQQQQQQQRQHRQHQQQGFLEKRVKCFIRRKKTFLQNHSALSCKNKTK